MPENNGPSVNKYINKVGEKLKKKKDSFGFSMNLNLNEKVNASVSAYNTDHIEFAGAGAQAAFEY